MSADESGGIASTERINPWTSNTSAPTASAATTSDTEPASATKGSASTTTAPAHGANISATGYPSDNPQNAATDAQDRPGATNSPEVAGSQAAPVDAHEAPNSLGVQDRAGLGEVGA